MALILNGDDIVESINKDERMNNANSDGVTVEKRSINAESIAEQKPWEDVVVDESVSSPRTSSQESNSEPAKSSKLPLIIIVSLLVMGGLIFLFCKLPAATTGLIRDIALIIFVLESIVSLIAFVVMVTQLSQLFNFLKYELTPIIDNTQKTVRRFSGTVSFLCDNAVEPTIEAAAKVSGVQNAINGVLGIFKKL